ncbi:MAG: hypothetical protein IJ041_08210 [Clostridia bacterium]|nr:hypothetical protein [Clostridia bacterium]
MENDQNWRFCIVGNAVHQHTDANGQVLYGTKAFTGGTKLYINDRTWEPNHGSAFVIGLNRFGHYAVEQIPVELIENLRIQRVFKPTVLEIMDYLEKADGWLWRGRTAEDRRALVAFVEDYGRS